MVLRLKRAGDGMAIVAAGEWVLSAEASCMSAAEDREADGNFLCLVGTYNKTLEAFAVKEGAAAATRLACVSLESLAASDMPVPPEAAYLVLGAESEKDLRAVVGLRDGMFGVLSFPRGVCGRVGVGGWG